MHDHKPADGKKGYPMAHTVKAPYNDHTGLQQFGHYSALLLKRYNDI